jgi:hypothetical protein
VTDISPLPVALPTKAALTLCIAGMLYLGLLPEAPLREARHLAASFQKPVVSKELPLQKEAQHHP